MEDVEPEASGPRQQGDGLVEACADALAAGEREPEGRPLQRLPGVVDVEQPHREVRERAAVDDHCALRVLFFLRQLAEGDLVALRHRVDPIDRRFRRQIRVACVLERHAVAHERDRLEEIRDRHAHARGVREQEGVGIDHGVLAGALVPHEIVGEYEQRAVRDVDSDQLEAVARLPGHLRRRERLALELLVEPAPERLTVREAVPAQEVHAPAHDDPGPREVLEVAELRPLHQLRHVVGVVAAREVAGDDRACTRAGDVDPLLDGLLRMLREAEQRTREAEALDAAAAEDSVGFFDPLHFDQPLSLVVVVCRSPPCRAVRRRAPAALRALLPLPPVGVAAAPHSASVRAAPGRARPSPSAR